MSPSRIWFPDRVASWFDAFQKEGLDVLMNRSRQVREHARKFASALMTNPHETGARIQDWIKSGGAAAYFPRLDAALYAASGVMQDVGITRNLGGGDDWQRIREHFCNHGNLLTFAKGFLLPGCEEDFEWKVPPPEKRYDLRFAYPGFARGVSDRFDVQVTYVPDMEVPIETLRKELRVAVVPLVADVNDFQWISIDADPPRFRVALKDPDAMARHAHEAIAEAGREQCDIVIFPELCFGDDQQRSLGRVIARTAATSHGYPWLVVAGTAHAPTHDASTDCHNRAIVFDGMGRELLRYHKLHPYEISIPEQERYGLATALGTTARMEDIVTSPRNLGVLQTPIGRIAVLICEDIWNLDRFLSIVSDLSVDWLLVPVLDGIQHSDRWTGRNAAMYAERGTSVVVATSTSLVDAHRKYMEKLAPGSLYATLRTVGLLSTPSSTERIRVFQAGAQHHEPSILMIRSIDR